MRQKIVCLIFNKGVSGPEDYNFRPHYEIMHKERFSHLQGKVMKDKSNVLKLDLQGHENVFTAASKSNEAAVGIHFFLFRILL